MKTAQQLEEQQNAISASIWDLRTHVIKKHETDSDSLIQISVAFLKEAEIILVPLIGAKATASFLNGLASDILNAGDKTVADITAEMVPIPDPPIDKNIKFSPDTRLIDGQGRLTPMLLQKNKKGEPS